MSATASSVKTHCLSPARARRPIDAAIDPHEDGNRLGPVGGRIVVEVMMTILDRDPSSVRFAEAGWSPRGSLIDLWLGSGPAGHRSAAL